MRPARPELEGTYPHHPDCPACWADRRLDDAIRHVEGLRRARVQDDTIQLTLSNGWYPDWLVNDALKYADVPPIVTPDNRRHATAPNPTGSRPTL